MPRDWNSAYENGDTPWDKGFPAPPLSEFIQLLNSGKVGRSSDASRWIEGQVLVPGCGSGHDVRLLASCGFEVTGLDIAPSALQKARAFPPVGTETYALGDFLNLPEEHHSAYDWLVEHTCLCAIEPSERKSYVNSLKQALKPEGSFLAVFFREVSDYTGDGPPHPISAEEIDMLFLDDFEVLDAFIPRQTYPSRPVGAEEVRWMRLRYDK